MITQICTSENKGKLNKEKSHCVCQCVYLALKGFVSHSKLDEWTGHTGDLFTGLENIQMFINNPSTFKHVPIPYQY